MDDNLLWLLSDDEIRKVLWTVVAMLLALWKWRLRMLSARMPEHPKHLPPPYDFGAESRLRAGKAEQAKGLLARVLESRKQHKRQPFGAGATPQ